MDPAPAWPPYVEKTIVIESAANVVVDTFCVVGVKGQPQLVVVPTGPHGWLKVFDLDEPTNVWTVHIHFEEPGVRGVVKCCAAPESAGTVLVSRGYQVREVRVRGETNIHVRTIVDHVGHPASYIAHMAANEHVVAILYSDGLIKLLDWKGGSYMSEFRIAAPSSFRWSLFLWLVLTHDGRHVIAGDANNKFLVKVTLEGTRVWKREICAMSGIEGASGSCIAIPCGMGGTIVQFSSDGDEIGRTFECGTEYATRLTATRDGRVVMGLGVHSDQDKNFWVFARCLKLRMTWMQAAALKAKCAPWVF